MVWTARWYPHCGKYPRKEKFPHRSTQHMQEILPKLVSECVLPAAHNKCRSTVFRYQALLITISPRDVGITRDIIHHPTPHAIWCSSSNASWLSEDLGRGRKRAALPPHVFSQLYNSTLPGCQAALKLMVDNICSIFWSLLWILHFVEFILFIWEMRQNDIIQDNKVFWLLNTKTFK